MDKKGHIDPSIINELAEDAIFVGGAIIGGIKKILGRNKD